jgi:hypothetical protein
MKESYGQDEKIPFGAYVTYHRISQIFSDYRILSFDQPFDSLNNYVTADLQKGYSLYFLITKSLLLNDSDVNGLLDYVKSGNDLFLSADFIDQKLTNQLKINIDRNAETATRMNGVMKDTWVSMDYGVKIKGSQYGYFYFPFLNYFTDYPQDYSRVLGVNENNQANFILFFLGKGRLYLHLAPKAFSNYFLMTNKNIHYLENVFSYLRLSPNRVFWDDYYNHLSAFRMSGSGNKNNFSSLQVVMQHPGLKWTFWIIVALILLFVLTQMKRKQRVIPQVNTPVNATGDFVQSISRLYYQNKNNKQIAEKMISYFYESLRNKYFINIPAHDERFLQQLLEKSEGSTEDMNTLVGLIEMIHAQEKVSDEELKELNKRIENFNTTIR